MSEYVYFSDNYLTIVPGEPFRLLPVGKLVKDGKVRTLTRELLAKFKLPHFKPAIKLGSHADETRAGGHITGLEVRDDGLYAIPEFTDEGRAALERGDYRYHSPEIIWDGAFEDPETGADIDGPLVVGTAMLHMPHLGERASLYSVEIIEGDETMTTNQDMVSVGALEKLINMFKGDPQQPAEPQEPQAPAEPVETFEADLLAVKAERDQFAAKVDELESAQVRGERITAYTAELGEKVEPDVYNALADLPEETADLLLKALKALGAQADAAGLTEDVGNAGADVNDDPTDALNAAVLAVQTERKVGYTEAFGIVQKEQPQLFAAYAGGD